MCLRFRMHLTDDCSVLVFILRAQMRKKYSFISVRFFSRCGEFDADARMLLGLPNAIRTVQTTKY